VGGLAAQLIHGAHSTNSSKSPGSPGSVNPPHWLPLSCMHNQRLSTRTDRDLRDGVGPDTLAVSFMV